MPITNSTRANARKKKKVNYVILNFVITPSEKQNTRRYIELIDKIHKQKIEINTHSDKFTALRLFFPNYRKNVLSGTLVNFTKLNPKLPGFNRNTNEIEHISYDQNIGPNAKEEKFFFVPIYHRLFIRRNSKFSYSQVIKFFQEAFTQVINDDESININTETSKEGIEKIISANIKSLKINLSYSNNDNYEDWDEIIDNELKDNNISNASYNYHPENGKNITIPEKSLIRSQLNLSRHNGYAEAKTRENGKLITIKTTDHPLVIPIELNEDDPSILEQNINNTCINEFGTNEPEKGNFQPSFK